MARQSQEFCEQNSLKIVLSALLSWFGTIRLFYSDMWNIVWMDIRILQKMYFLTQFTQFWEESQKLHWKPSSGTGWNDWFGSLHTKLIIVHKVNPTDLLFAQSRSGTEMLNLRGKPYTQTSDIISWRGLCYSNGPILD
jgi:hypothetical protein